MACPSRDGDDKNNIKTPSSTIPSPNQNNDPNQNPFIAWRRFADQQFSSIFGLLRDISDDIASRQNPSPRSHPDAARGEDTDIIQRLLGTLQTQQQQLQSRTQDAQERCSHADSPESSIQEVFSKGYYTDMLSPSYMLHGAYAPAQLEKSMPGKHWRAAFEELLFCGAHGQVTGDDARFCELRESPLDWMFRLKQMREENEQHAEFVMTQRDLNLWRRQREEWERVWGLEENEEKREVIEKMKAWWTDEEQEEQEDENDKEEDADDEDEEDDFPSTEQELYERFFGITDKITDTAPADPSGRHSGSVQPSTPTSYKPSILSTMTTTERTVLPDGTITTKIVLRKRFANGKEETSETVHTTHAGLQERRADEGSGSGESVFDHLNLSGRRRHGEIEGHENVEDKEERKGGWFWR